MHPLCLASFMLKNLFCFKQLMTCDNVETLQTISKQKRRVRNTAVTENRRSVGLSCR